MGAIATDARPSASPIKSIQRGSVTLGPSATTFTIVAVSLEKAILRINTSWGYSNSIRISGYLFSSTQMKFDRNLSTNSDIYYEVVEYT